MPKSSDELLAKGFSDRISDVVLTDKDLIHYQFRLVVINVLNYNVNFHKRLQTYGEETKARD